MYRIALIGGDGIGPEVVREGVKVLHVLADKYNFQVDTTDYPFGADHYLETGELIPDEALEEIQEHDAVLLGAAGDPRCETGVLERGIVGRLRWDLDLYINLRPIKLYAEHLCPIKGMKPEDLDILVIRENTEGIYGGIGGNFKPGLEDEVAIQNMMYTRGGIERCIRYAFEACRARNQDRKLTLVDKSNAIPAHRLWRQIMEEIGAEYPDIEIDYAFVDATCMWMIKNPQAFDTIVTTNMFGDIITDLGAMLQGGLGIAAGGNIAPGRFGVFEPIHGSAPKYRDKNVANPLATIASMAMMLEYLGESKAAAETESVIQNLLSSKKIPSLGADSGFGTTQIGDMVAELVAKAEPVKS